MAVLEAVAYVSSAIGEMSEADLEQLLENARSRNLERSITGVLLFHEGNFFQYFEGPPDGVEDVYQRIRNSALHRDIFEFMRRPVIKREFPEWLMGFTHVPKSALLQLNNASWHSALVQSSARGTFSDGMTLVHNFWQVCNRI